jgi:hypothetical protein
MKIVICGSISFPGKMREIRKRLLEMGHDVVIPHSIDSEDIRSHEDAERLKQTIRYRGSLKGELTIRHFNEIKNGDAILVVNEDKRGIPNYIGGATFAEMMFAFYVGKRIFLLNPIPTHERLSFFRDEIEGIRPTVINRNLELIE